MANFILENFRNWGLFDQYFCVF